MTDLLVASRNAKKLAELHRVLDAAGVSGLRLLSLNDVPAFDEAPETGATFEENALAKARDAFLATGVPAVADDSGLAVDALNGMPGVLSARWAGAHGDEDPGVGRPGRTGGRQRGWRTDIVTTHVARLHVSYPRQHLLTGRVAQVAARARSAGTSNANARPRCDAASFSAGVSSAAERVDPSGTKIGS